MSPFYDLILHRKGELQSETVQEAMQAYANAVIFKSSLGTGKGVFVQALQTLSEGGVYLPEEIRQLRAAEAPNPNLPPLS